MREQPTKSEVLGAICDECGGFLAPARSQYGKWFCPRCLKHRKKSHQEKYGRELFKA